MRNLPKIGGVFLTAFILLACQSSLKQQYNEKQQYNDLEKYGELTFTRVVLDYLSQVELTDNVVRRFIASSVSGQNELSIREESGIDLNSLIKENLNDIKKSISERPIEYSEFSTFRLDDYNYEDGYFLTKEWGETGGNQKNLYSNNYNSYEFDGYQKSEVHINFINWVIPMNKNQAYTLIKNHKDRMVSIYFTYKLKRCKYKPGGFSVDFYGNTSMEYNSIICYYDVTSVKLFDTDRIDNYTKPLYVGVKNEKY